MTRSTDDTQFEGTRAQELITVALDPDDPITVHIIPQAHIDLAWQWTADDGAEMVLETFRAQVELLEADASRTFAQSQLAAYDIVRREDPALFGRVRGLIERGQWEIVGGEWVEPDRALPGGEALVRQILEGQRFAREHLGTEAIVAWCPDSFTFHPGNLPQLMTQAGIRFQAIKRPREKWMNLPLLPFRWKGLDGTELITYRSNNKGNGLPTVSEGYVLPEGVTDLEHYAEAFRAAGLKDLWGPRGVGDTGGINEFPKPASGDGWSSHYSTPSRYVEALERWGRAGELDEIGPAISHVIMPGCLTTHAEMKALNRRAENLLQSTEVISCLAERLGVGEALNLSEQWQQVLFNQFHDVVTGVGIPETHTEAEHAYREVIRIGEKQRRKSLRAIARGIGRIDGPAAVVVNDLGWKRTDLVEMEIDLREHPDVGDEVPGLWEAIAPDGSTTSVIIEGTKRAQNWTRHRVTFVAHDIPAMGYRVYRLQPAKRKPATVRRNGCEIMNGHLSVRFDPSDGCVEALINRTDAVQLYGRMAVPHLHEEGQYFLDYGVEHRAWYLGLTGNEKLVTFEGLRITGEHPSRVSLETFHTFGDSSIRQEFIVRHGLEHIEVKVSIDWHEIEHLLRLHFGAPLDGDVQASYDSAYGVIDWPTDGREMVMQNFCDMAGANGGLALLNDGRYGAMCDGEQMTLSAVRCSTRPDPRSDEGIVTFRYGMVPHPGDWREGDLVRRGHAFNRPLVGFALDLASTDRGINAPLEGEWGLLSGETGNILPVVLKRSHDGDAHILRAFNADSEPGTLKLDIPGASSVTPVSIIEDPVGDSLTLPSATDLRPFEVASYRLNG
jgi:alpha-mannosidase